MNVLIIEDDPMVDFIHRNYLEKLEQCDLIISSNSISDAKEKLEHFKIDLVLLDIHIADGNGLELLEYLRSIHHDSEVIIISAANDSSVIKSGLHLGVIDYLIKPFTFDRFQESINRFVLQKSHFTQGKLNQKSIDSLTSKQHVTEKTDGNFLDKGLSQSTLELIKKTIASFNESFTIPELAEKSQLSHVSVRKYAAYLEECNLLESRQIYTKVGRAYRIYFKK
ncbi:response regulator [Streptococcus iniae]|uniref:response regulator n=1 Tax=Streptococcus iniae TaxID=1346 RepID=UPI003D981D52